MEWREREREAQQDFKKWNIVHIHVDIFVHISLPVWLDLGSVALPHASLCSLNTLINALILVKIHPMFLKEDFEKKTWVKPIYLEGDPRNYQEGSGDMRQGMEDSQWIVYHQVSAVSSWTLIHWETVEDGVAYASELPKLRNEDAGVLIHQLLSIAGWRLLLAFPAHTLEKALRKKVAGVCNQWLLICTVTTEGM